MFAEITIGLAHQAARMRTALFVTLLVAVILPARAMLCAQDLWISSSGDWSLASNWSGNIPNANDVASVMNSGTATIALPGQACQFLVLGGTAGSGTVQMLGGSLRAWSYDVGSSGVGRFVQLDGTSAPSNYLFVGRYAGSNGTYYLSGGLLSTASELVGDYGSGAITQTGGTNMVGPSALVLSSDPNAFGAYNLSGTGLLSAPNEIVGQGGPAVFTQSGGTNSAGGISIGYQSAAASGSYNLSGGLLNAAGHDIAIYGGSSFVQSGGSNTAATLMLGLVGNSVASYSLLAGQLSAGTEQVGYLGGVCDFTQSGGTNTCGSLLIGTYGGGGTYNLNGGLLRVSQIGTGVGTQVLSLNGGTLQATGLLSTSLPIALGASGVGMTLDTGGYTVTLSGQLYGPGGLTKTGEGTLVLLAVESFAGPATVSAGTLQLGNGGYYYDASLPGNITNNGAIVFNLPRSETYKYSISGSGGLTQSCSGPLILTGSNTYTGPTMIVHGGTLQIGNGWSGASIDGTSDVTDNGSLIFNHSDAVTFSQVISGIGDVTQTGSGLLLLTGSNFYTGATIIGAGTLQVGNGGSGIGSTSGVTDNGSLVFNHADSVTFNPVISGSGSLAQTGSGLLILTGANTYKGATFVNGGTLEIGNGGNGASIGGTSGVIDNASLVFNHGNTFTFSPAISGTGSVEMLGSGLLALTGANTYSGPTLISGGTLQIGNGGSGASFSGTADVTNNASLVFNHSSSLTFKPAISGSGGLTKTGTGLLTLTGASTYSGPTLIIAGTLQVGNGGSGASIGGTSGVIDNAKLTFNHADAITFNPIISGSGSLTQTGSGLLVLIGSNSYSGPTIILGGTLEIGNGGSGASIGSTLSVTDYASLVFNHADTINFSQVISGTGSVTQSGSGLLVLTGSNNYSGATLVNGGTLVVGNGGNGASIGSTSGVVDNASLIFNHGDAVTFNPVISGSGCLTQTGSGLLILTGPSTYTGSTLVDRGTLQVGNGGSGASIGGTSGVIDNASLIFNHAGTATLNASISGSGNLTKSGSGLLVLLGANSYSGTTQINGGTIEIGNGGGSGTLGGGPITNKAALVFDRGDSLLVVPNVISGSGSLTQIGTGTLTLAATNTYTGNTFLNAGTLNLGNGAAIQNSTVVVGGGALGFGGGTAATLGGLAGSGSITLTNSAGTAVALSIGANNASTTYSGALADNSAAGSLNKVGTGTLTLTGSNTYTGPTIVSGGTLQIGNGITDGSIAATSGINDNGILGLNVVSSQVFATAISGSGGLLKAGSGTLSLTGGNTFTGPITVNGGSLIGNTASLSGSINLANGTKVIFSQPASGVFNRTISGSGSVTVQGPGPLTFAGSSSYSGGSLLQGGVFNVASNTALGIGTVTLAGGTLGLNMTIPSQPAAIGVHFVGYGDPVNGSAGVVPMSNWNNLTGYSYSGVHLSDNSGLTTSASLSTSGANWNFYSNSSNPLLNGYIATGGNAISLTVTGIPYAGYSLYAYMADINASGLNEKMTVAGTTYYYTMTNSAAYAQVTNTTAGIYPVGNYIAATGLSGGSQTVSIQGIGQPYASICGLEIVNVPTVMLNALTLTADSAIDVTGSTSAALVGMFSIGGNRLSVTGGGTGPDSGYSLALGGNGGVSLGGNPIFDVTNNGSGVGTLVLGSLNDGGVARTITKTGSGILSLVSAAKAMAAGDTVNVNSGTLSSNSAGALGSMTTVNVAGGATFSLGASQTIGALCDAGAVVPNAASVLLNGCVLTVGSSKQSSTFSGVIADGVGEAGSLIKTGTGIFTLAGSNTFTGSTTVSAGTLALGNPMTLQKSTLNVGSAGTVGFGSLTTATLGGLSGAGSLDLDNASSVAVALQVGSNGTNTTFSGALSGAGSLIKAGSGTLLVSGSNSYSGSTVVAAGSLQATVPAALSGCATPGAIAVGSGAALTLSAGGSGWGAADIGSLLNANGAGFVLGSTLGIDTSGGSLTLDANIAGSMGLAKLGGNTLALTGSNTYTGPTVVAQGTLQAVVPAAMPGYATAGTIRVSKGAILAVSAGGSGWAGADIDSLVSANGAGFVTGSLLGIDTSDGDFAYGSGITGNMGLTKLGNNALILTAPNTYAGTTVVAAGTLVLGDPAVLQQSTLDTSGSGALSFGALTSASLGGLTGTGTLGLVNAASAAVALSVGTSNSSTTFTGALNGTGNLVKIGGGTLLLGGANSYAGGTLVAAGTLEAAGTASLPGYATPGSVAVESGATLALRVGGGGFAAADIDAVVSANGGGFAAGSMLGIDTSNGAAEYDSVLAGSMGLSVFGGNVLTLLGSNTYTGPTIVTSGTLQIGNGGSGASIGGTSGVINNASLVFNHGDAVSFSPSISGNGSLTQTGQGILILAGTNSYTGPTIVSSGTLQIGNGAADGSIASSSGVKNNATLVFDLVGNQTYGGVISGSGGFCKTGSGTLTLTGSNTFTGPTRIDGGSLVGNTASLPGAISLANNANVGFNQIVNGTFNSTIGGSGSLTVQGPGALTLTNSNSYTAGTTIAGGTLRTTNTSALGSGQVTLSGGVLSLAGTASIGVQFSGFNPITGMAGVAPMMNWNQLTNSGIWSFSNVALTDNAGAATGATLSTTNFSCIGSRTSSNPILGGYIATGGFTPLIATIHGIPYSNYSLYAYLGGNGDGLNERVTLAGSSYYFSSTKGPDFLQVINTAAGTYPTGNYVVATGLTGGTQAITVQGVTQTSGSYCGFCGIEIVNTGSTAQVWALANPLTVTADSTIDVTGPSSGAVTGLLTIGNNRLSVTGGGAAPSTSYSLTLGNSGGVLLAGNPVLDIADNGSAAGTLVLGALNDGGQARTITKTGMGALTLGDAAIAMDASDTVNVSGGTLNTASGTALGTLTAVNVAGSATFVLGASQTVGALGDTGAVALNSAGVLLDGNTLTIGGSKNLSSTFSGVISDGAGGSGRLIKAGTGTLALCGSNTYTGGTTVTAGTLYIAALGGLPDNSSLTVDAGGTFLFAAAEARSPGAIAGGQASSGSAPSAVPEPGTLALLVAFAALLAARARNSKQLRRTTG
jgi:fibronectin-binding autotransporter adhesin